MRPNKRLAAAQRPSFAEALRCWFKLGWISFGGTAAHIAIMQDELVEKKRWISNGMFLHALSHCMLLPGPEAQQLRHRPRNSCPAKNRQKSPARACANHRCGRHVCGYVLL